MLQKRIKLPSKKKIASDPKNSKKNLIKIIPKADSAKKNSNINTNLNPSDLDINNINKNSTITTDSNTTEDTLKRIFIYHKNLTKQKNTLNQKSSKKNLAHVISHDNISSKKKSNRFNTIECRDFNNELNDLKYGTLNDINKLNTNRNNNLYNINNSKNFMILSDKNIFERMHNNNQNIGNNRNFNYINNINNYFYTQNFAPQEGGWGEGNSPIPNFDKKVKNVIIKRKEIINIEDILLLEEKFFEVNKAINLKSNICNECFEFINFYNQSSLYDKLETYFKDYQSKFIVHCSVMLTIFDIILIYHVSFNLLFFELNSNILSTLVKMNHQSYLLICNYISNKVSSSEQENNWVKKLRKMLDNNINHLDIKNNKDFEMFIIKKNLNNSDLRLISIIIYPKYLP